MVHQCYLGKQQHHVVGKAEVLLINSCSSFFVSQSLIPKALPALT